MATKRRLDLRGQRFGRLVAVAENPVRYYTGEMLWDCVCDCGQPATSRTSSLRNGKKQSCGCLISDAAKLRCGERSAVWLGGKDNKGSIAWARRVIRSSRERREKGYLPLLVSDVELSAIYNSHSKLCDICGLGLGDDVNVDHDHETGQYRGLLHKICNFLVSDTFTVDMYREAITYVTKGKISCAS